MFSCFMLVGIFCSNKKDPKEKVWEPKFNETQTSDLYLVIGIAADMSNEIDLPLASRKRIRAYVDSLQFEMNKIYYKWHPKETPKVPQKGDSSKKTDSNKKK